MSFAKLFGAKKPEAPKVDAEQANAKINEQIENIEMRSKKIEND